MPKTQNRKAIEIKISTVVAVSAILHESNLDLLNVAMREMTGDDTNYFDGEFAVIDVGQVAIADVGMDWPALVSLFRAHRLNPVAVRNATPEMEPDIRALGLSLDVLPPPRQQLAVAEPPAKAETMIVDKPVRSGQRLYAQGCDLIVTAGVSNSAEVIADGSIHIYGPLRGRALAGASGNPQARIFAMQMEAELVSIAGMYRTFEDGLPKNLAQQAVQIRLVGDRIELHSLNRI